jgi:aconitase A
MAPEYGATCGFFPIDDTIKYLRDTGRSADRIASSPTPRRRAYRSKTTPDPIFTDVLKPIRVGRTVVAGPSVRRIARLGRSRTASPPQW